MATEEVSHEHHSSPATASGHPAVPDPGSAGSPAPPVTHFNSQYERFKALQAEYRMTVRVLAVVSEQLLRHFGELKGIEMHELALSDEALMDAPELVAWRDEAKMQTIIRVRR